MVFFFFNIYKKKKKSSKSKTDRKNNDRYFLEMSLYVKTNRPGKHTMIITSRIQFLNHRLTTIGFIALIALVVGVAENQTSKLDKHEKTENYSTEVHLVTQTVIRNISAKWT